MIGATPRTEENAGLESPPGASSHEAQTWHTIRWHDVHRTVRRLQARIVKATQEGRWGKVKALQHLLTHSYSGKALAVKRVTENQGKRTPGVDGETWQTPEKKAKALPTLKQRGYHPQPLRRMYIPKKNGKMRPLGIPCVRDKIVQEVIRLILEAIYDSPRGPYFSDTSHGFRPHRSCHTALREFREKWTAVNWLIEGDIRACFDHAS